MLIELMSSVVKRNQFKYSLSVYLRFCQFVIGGMKYHFMNMFLKQNICSQNMIKFL